MNSNQKSQLASHESVPSEWVTRFGLLVPEAAQVLDVACGNGRHAKWFAEQGHNVVAVDRENLSIHHPRIDFRQADIEGGPWPYAGRQFGAVVVTNYLFRPLLTTLVDSVAPEGWLIYETFAVGNEQFGRPSRADFLLQTGELLEAVRGRLSVVAYENGYVPAPRPAMIQRIAARHLTGPHAS